MKAVGRVGPSVEAAGRVGSGVETARRFGPVVEAGVNVWTRVTAFLDSRI